MQRLPYMLILGDKESDTRTLTVRDRAGDSVENVSLDDFVAKVNMQILTKEKY